MSISTDDPIEPVGSSTAPPLEEFRAKALAWLEANLERRAPGEARPSSIFADGEDRTPEQLAAARALQRRLYEAGYAGISWPTEYGGHGLPMEFEQCFAELSDAFHLPDLGIAGGTTFGVCALTMLAHAAPKFLRRHIPRILAGDELVVQFFSDPEAGSDLAGVRTTAVRDGDRWILNGSKIWSSGAHYADWGMCLARTDWDVPKHRGLTWFAVPIRAKGVTVQRIKQINGDAEFCQEFFDDVEIADEDVIGDVNGGWAVTQTMLLFERGGALMHRRPDEPTQGIAPDLVAVARSAGRLDDPDVRRMIAKAHVDDLARRALLARLGALMVSDPGRAASMASYAKLASGIYDPARAKLAMRIGGPGAVAWADPSSEAAGAATAYLNSRFMSIAGGTNQMQLNTIGEKVLGLPREPSFDTDKPFRDVLRDAHTWSSGRSGR
jgi:alkylation response protein AidB-like acyl-CoA dehydrogenase